MKIKEKMSQIALGLAIVGIGAAASAFTNKEVEATRQNGFLTNNGGGNYVERASASGENCLDNEPRECSFQITSPENIPNQPTHSETQVQQYMNNGWIEPTGNQGTYVAP